MKKHIRHLKDPHFRRSLILSCLVLFASLIINFYAGAYATEKASNSVTDIILSNTKIYDLDGIFIYGSWLLGAFITSLCIKKIERAPFILKSISLFILIRSVFITLTHIGPFPQAMVIDPESFLRYFGTGGDLFFSGHTGLPFLMALIFWEEVKIRRIFLVISISFAVIVLLAHVHYTIDVVSAFFISYGIFHIAEKLFKKDQELFLHSPVE